jgi:hypothetical protein
MTALAPATVFPLPPDGATPIKVARTWLTDIQRADDGTETRVAVRDAPVRRMEFTAVFGNATEAGKFRSLWYTAAQPLRFLVPLWRELSTPSAIAGAVITTDTTNRRFVTGTNAAILWQIIDDEIVWEVVDVQSFDDDSITCTTAPTTPFTIGAVYVLPLMAAWLEPPTVDERGYAEVVPLVFVEELPKIAGIDDTVDGEVTPVVSTIQLYLVGGGLSGGHTPEFTVLRAVTLDGDGQRVTDPSLAWALDISDPALRLRVAAGRQTARVEYDGGLSSGHTLTVTSGATSVVRSVT